jgi:ribosomal protein S7
MLTRCPLTSTQCPIVERLTNALMYNGRNNGKKLMAVRIIKHTLEIIHLTTDSNPIQVGSSVIVGARVWGGTGGVVAAERGACAGSGERGDE